MTISLGNRFAGAYLAPTRRGPRVRTGPVPRPRPPLTRTGRDGAPQVSVVIPVLNEARALAVLLPELAPLDLHEVVLVDGGSTDGTVETAETLLPGIRVVHQVRSGRGNALAAGIAAATGNAVVTLDADGSCDPAEIPRFVRGLVDGADAVAGSRFLTGGAAAESRMAVGVSRMLSWAAQVALGVDCTDVGYGYRAFWADVVPELNLPDHRVMTLEAGQMLRGDGFEFEALVAGRLAAVGVQVVEVPSKQRPSRRDIGSAQLLHDGIRFLRALAVERGRMRSGSRDAAQAPETT